MGVAQGQMCVCVCLCAYVVVAHEVGSSEEMTLIQLSTMVLCEGVRQECVWWEGWAMPEAALRLWTSAFITLLFLFFVVFLSRAVLSAFLRFPLCLALTLLFSPPHLSLCIYSHVLRHHGGMWPVESWSDTWEYDVTALTYILARARRGGGAYCVKATFIKVRNWYESQGEVKPLKSTLQPAKHRSTLIFLCLTKKIVWASSTGISFQINFTFSAGSYKLQTVSFVCLKKFEVTEDFILGAFCPKTSAWKAPWTTTQSRLP